jgi:acetolactate synthase regulatory subunit
LFLCCFCFVVSAFICMFCIFMIYSTSCCCHYKLKGMDACVCVCVCVCVCMYVCTGTLKEIRIRQNVYNTAITYITCVCLYVCVYTRAHTYEGVSRSFRTGRLERELQMVQLSATRCSCIAISWVSLVSFAAITLCVASQRVVYFVINSVRKLLDTPSYIKKGTSQCFLSPTLPKQPVSGNSDNSYRRFKIQYYKRWWKEF